jgi:hypothetical protein
MSISAKAMELENQSIGANGAPTLGAAYEVLREQWESGERDRELALHLMFLAWYLVVEPPHLTGLDETRTPSNSLVGIFNAVHDWLLPTGTDTNDAEALYVVGLPASMFPWVLGDHDLWTARSEAYRIRYRQLAPDGIEPAVFDSRGAYGDYFESHARVVVGY